MMRSHWTAASCYSHTTLLGCPYLLGGSLYIYVERAMIFGLIYWVYIYTVKFRPCIRKLKVGRPSYLHVTTIDQL